MLSLCTYCAKGQNDNTPDTIYIYETVVVYDTVRLVKPKRKVENQLNRIDPIKYTSLGQLPFSKVNHQPFFSSASATLQQNNIIDSKNRLNKQKNESMKANLILAVAFLATQTLGYSQSRIGFTAGGGVWWAHGINQNAVTEVAPTFSVGAFINKPIIESKLNFEWELQYCHLTSNYSYKGKASPELWMSIGDSEAATAYHQLAIPFRMEWVLGQFTPYIGAEYIYRRAENWIKDVNGNTLSINRLGVITGVKYNPSNTWSFGINYHGGITEDFTLGIITTGPEGFSSGGIQTWHSSWVGVSAYYTIGGIKNLAGKMLDESEDVLKVENINVPAPTVSYNLIYRMSMATQVFSYKSIDDPNEYVERFLPGVGIGFNSSVKLNRFFDLKPQFSYIRKGCRGNEIPEIQPTASPKEHYYIVQTGTYKNQFHYLSIDLLVKLQSPKSRNVNPYFQTGFRGDALMAKSIEYQVSERGTESDYKDFGPLNYGMVNAFGLTFNGNYYIELEHNFDLGYLVDNDALRVINWMWGLNVGISLNR